MRRTRQAFGRCSLAPGHGHKLELIVSMAGGVSRPDGAMVMNLSDVQDAIRREVDRGPSTSGFSTTAGPDLIYSRGRADCPTTESLAPGDSEQRFAPHCP